MSSMATSSDHPLQSRFIGMFSYGSNNEQQLRARVNSPQLRYERSALKLRSEGCCPELSLIERTHGVSVCVYPRSTTAVKIDMQQKAFFNGGSDFNMFGKKLMY